MSKAKKKILLVDDEKNILLSFSQMFEWSGSDLEVFTACDGLAALQIIRSTPIDLVATDLKMPKMDGFELLEILGKEYPGLPVIVWTTYVSPSVVDRCFELGAIKFIELPIDFDQFYKTVRAVLNSKHIYRYRKGWVKAIW